MLPPARRHEDKALAATPMSVKLGRFRPSDKLLAFLEAL
jgi:hypothetical protein